MRYFILLLLLACSMALHAQELYVFTEPASNCPGGSATAKLMTRFTRNQYTNRFAQRYSPEIMLGLSKKLMLKTNVTFSDLYSDKLRFESARMYAKWRFLSNDGIHQHFRMAAFGEVAYSRNDMIYDEMSLEGDNSGVQAGVIATQLLGKLAVSGSASWMQVFNEMESMPGHHMQFDKNSLNYSVSVGYLLFPRQYNSYQQTNLNLYVEALGMKGIEAGKYYLDIAPALQLIFASTTRLNLGARYQATGNMTRISPNNYFVSLETIFLNILKKNKHKTAAAAL